MLQTSQPPLANNVGVVLLIPAAPVTLLGVAAIATAVRRHRHNSLPARRRVGRWPHSSSPA